MIVVEGFECIYCINLVGMGVLLFEFKLGVDCKILKLDGIELYSVIGNIVLCLMLILVIECVMEDGKSEIVEVFVICCLDIEEEVFVYEVGGVL